MTCTCKEWEPNIKIINGMIGMQSVMAWGNKKGYTGKPFQFCPWCGRKLVKEQDETENKPAKPE